MLDLRFGFLVKTVYIVDWKRLETPNSVLIKNITKFGFEKVFF